MSIKRKDHFDFIEMWESGKSISDIASSFGVKKPRVYKLALELRKNGVKLTKKGHIKPDFKNLEKHREKIAKALKGGEA